MKELLSICIAGFIGACGGADEPAAQAQKAPPVKIPAYVRETQAGNYLAGLHAQRSQDWQAASRYMRRVLQNEPEDQDLQQQVMVLAMGSGETAQAIAAARKLLETEPDNALAVLFVVMDSFTRQEYDQTIKLMESMSNNSVVEFLQPMLLAWAYSAKGELRTDQLTDHPMHVYHALLVADYLGKVDAVDPYVQRVLQDESIDLYELEKIADIYARHGGTEKALALFKAIENEQPDRTDLKEKIDALENKRSLSEMQSIQPVESPQAGAAEALFDVARLLFREEHDESAVVFSRMALHLNPSLTEARLLLGNVMARYERFDDAIGYHAGVAQDNALYIDAQRSAADLLEHAGRIEEAVTLLRNLYDAHKDVQSLILAGDLYRRTEKFPQAVEAYDDAAKALGNDIPEDYWHLLYGRGMAYEQMGEWPKAEADLKAALKFRPNHPYLLNYLGYGWADRGQNLEGSLDLIQQAAVLRPDDGYIADSLGWVLYRMDRYEDSVPHLEKAVELMPYDAVVNDHLGDAYWRVGRKVEAQFQWQRARNHTEDQKLVESIDAKLHDGLPAQAQAPAGLREAKTADAPDTLNR